MLFSSDAEYGQIMMFSYDCFARFHFLLQWYFAGLTGDWEALGISGKKGEEDGGGEEDEGGGEVMEKTVTEHRKWLRQYFMVMGDSSQSMDGGCSVSKDTTIV